MTIFTIWIRPQTCSPRALLPIMCTLPLPSLAICTNSCCVFVQNISYHEDKQTKYIYWLRFVHLYGLAASAYSILGCASHGTHTSGDMTVYYHIDSGDGKWNTSAVHMNHALNFAIPWSS
ncbi:hypothetical protein BDW42DRAFT_7305 [Aspergillus taichungensis]|uniref:Uncharacterized protein n=1 Tax=Aspergillus taichungensis TaxID=482145 RepID=A0A2J5HJF9_9EURO|nr:hypothetical protein BDW42DRAFT_7305 [Aspergillus taichungensis]